MKITLLFTIFIFLNLFLKQETYAQEIQTGNASAKSSVETNIEGNGNVETHIEIQANGEKKVIDSNKPGKIEVTLGSKNNSIETEKDSSPAANIKKEIKNINNQKITSDKLLNDIANFFKKIFKFFDLF